MKSTQTQKNKIEYKLLVCPECNTGNHISSSYGMSTIVCNGCERLVVNVFKSDK